MNPLLLKNDESNRILPVDKRMLMTSIKIRFMNTDVAG